MTEILTIKTKTTLTFARQIKHELEKKTINKKGLNNKQNHDLIDWNIDN